PFRTERTIEDWIKALQDGDTETRKSAALRLADGPPAKAVPALIKALDDKDFMVRCCVVVALGEHAGRGSNAAIKALGSALKNEKDRVVRRSLVRALVELSANKEAVSALIEALKDKDVALRRAVLNDLIEMRRRPPQAIPALVQRLDDEHTDLRL